MINDMIKAQIAESFSFHSLLSLTGPQLLNGNPLKYQFNIVFNSHTLYNGFTEIDSKHKCKFTLQSLQHIYKQNITTQGLSSVATLHINLKMIWNRN